MPRLPDPATSRAVLIGTSTYTDPELTALPGVANNLTDLAAVLTSGTGMPGEHCRVLRDPPDQGVVGEVIVAAAAEAEDVLLVYYSGHGLMTWDKRNELCLAMRDTRAKSVRTSALHCTDLRQYISDSPARTRVLILDCCFGGRAVEHSMASPADTLLAKVDVAGAYVLAATEDVAHAPPERRNTLFTGELLRLLRQGIPDESAMLLTLDTLFQRITSAMRARHLTAPRANGWDAAAHLALGPNPAHEVCRALDELTAEEAKTERAYAAAIDKIAQPNLRTFTPQAPALYDRLSNMDTVLADVLDDVKNAMKEAEAQATLAQGLVDRRDELRGKLAGYEAIAIGLGVAEEPEVSRRYAIAHDLLWTKPCPLSAATRAVNAYQQVVTDFREGRR